MREKVPYQQLFWYKVTPSDSGCWEWQGAISRAGYGFFSVNRKLRTAHRVSYEMCVGDIPEGTGYHGTCVMHICDNRRCVNPSHLRLGTQRDNLNDMVAKGRAPKHRVASSLRLLDKSATCGKGLHAWTEENIRLNGNGNRICRHCRSINKRHRRLARKA